MPIHTGTADEYRDMGRRALAIGEQIAALLNDPQQIAPGSVAANVSGLGFRIVRRGSGFTAVQDR